LILESKVLVCASPFFARRDARLGNFKLSITDCLRVTQRDSNSSASVLIFPVTSSALSRFLRSLLHSTNSIGLTSPMLNNQVSQSPRDVCICRKQRTNGQER
jgi:hypothetical protein